MENVRRFRAMGQLCRQQAAYNPVKSWELLSEAERWEHLAEAEIVSHFRACNAANSNEEMQPPAADSALRQVIDAA